MKTYEIVRDEQVLAVIRCADLKQMGSGQTLQLFDRHGLPFLSAVILKCTVREKVEPAGPPPEGAAA